jgi:hypothetical protein
MERLKNVRPRTWVVIGGFVTLILTILFPWESTMLPGGSTHYDFEPIWTATNIEWKYVGLQLTAIVALCVAGFFAMSWYEEL